MGTKVIFTATLLTLVFACANPADQKADEKSSAAEFQDSTKLAASKDLVESIEIAHGEKLFRKNEAIQFDLNLTFGGKERFNGTLFTRTDGSEVKMVDSAGVKYWDGSKVRLIPSDTNMKKARFDLLTWSYFFLAPYKLNDPGTNHAYLGDMPLGEASFPANKLTFNQGVGDTPDDWYVVYKDSNSDLLAAMAYIVTSGDTKVEEAEKDPHVITYEAYVEVGGIPFATQWNFWTWNKEGEMKKLLGSATISNIKFEKKAGDTFNLAAL